MPRRPKPAVLVIAPKIPDGWTLGLDFGSHLGWAVGYHGYAKGGTVYIAASVHEPRALRFKYFLEFVEGVILNPDNAEPIKRIVYEMPFNRGESTKRMMFGFAAFVHMLCGMHGLRYYECHTNTLKKHATGNGHAEKPLVIAAAKRKWPHEQITDDNHADALWLMDYGASGLAEVALQSRYQRRAMLAQKVKGDKSLTRRMTRVDTDTRSSDADECPKTEGPHDWTSDFKCVACGYDPAEE